MTNEEKYGSIMEDLRSGLERLRDFVSANNDNLNFYSKEPPDASRWEDIKLAREVEFVLLEHLTDYIDTASGEPPTYIRYLFDLMTAAKAPPVVHKTIDGAECKPTSNEDLQQEYNIAGTK